MLRPLPAFVISENVIFRHHGELYSRKFKYISFLEYYFHIELRVPAFLVHSTDIMMFPGILWKCRMVGSMGDPSLLSQKPNNLQQKTLAAVLARAQCTLLASCQLNLSPAWGGWLFPCLPVPHRQAKGSWGPSLPTTKRWQTWFPSTSPSTWLWQPGGTQLCTGGRAALLGAFLFRHKPGTFAPCTSTLKGTRSWLKTGARGWLIDFLVGVFSLWVGKDWECKRPNKGRVQS